MTKPASPSSHGSNVPADASTLLTFEDHLRIFWKKNSKTVLILVAVLLAGVIAKGGWEYVEQQKEEEIGRAFASASTPEQLKTFADAHSGHMLGAVARLRIADAAYAAGKASEAVAAYDEAAARLKSGPLASRAKLGLAMAKLQAGKTAEGESALKALMADVNEMKATRVEAAYHLASLASVAGKSEEVKKYSDELMKIDANSPWAQRVFMLRASMPVADVPPNLNIAPVALPPSGK